MKLYDVAASPNCRKVRVAARELGLRLELVPVDLSAPKRPEYLERNPTGKVPTLVGDDGTAIWESGAILVHLAERHTAAGSDLLPVETHARARVFRWLFFGSTHLQPWISVLGQERIMKARAGRAPDASAIAFAERELARFLPIVEDALREREYLVERYTIADIALGCGLEGSEARGLSLQAYPAIEAWRARLRARAAWRE